MLSLSLTRVMNMLVANQEEPSYSEGFSLSEKCNMVHLWPILSKEGEAALFCKLALRTLFFLYSS